MNGVDFELILSYIKEAVDFVIVGDHLSSKKLILFPLYNGPSKVVFTDTPPSLMNFQVLEAILFFDSLL